MQSAEIRKRFLSFFEKRGHAIVPSASLVPEGDASTLFTTAGMQPLVPYLMGQKHPSGNRIVNVQKCMRTGDIESVGDTSHLTFFEMMGNWSLGDYFKEDAIKWSYELLTDKEEGFGLDQDRIYVSVFEGNDDAPFDETSKKTWMSVGIPENRIYALDAEENWWSPGDNGPSGPDTEIFYDLTENGLGELSREQFIEADKKGDVVEIWNNVFMEYEKKDGKVVGTLSQQNVDTGAGLERFAAVLQEKDNVFETDVFTGLMDSAAEITNDIRRQRIVADHLRSAVFAVADGVLPANTDGGYVLRRLIRRAIMQTDNKKLSADTIASFVNAVMDTHGDAYPEIVAQAEHIQSVIVEEVERFTKTLTKGLKEFNWSMRSIERGKVVKKELPPQVVFNLVTTYGFPFELVEEEAKSRDLSVDKGQFENRMEAHRVKSRAASAGKFKGGLADSSEETTNLHTAHHLLLAALQKVLGGEVKQRGSNITGERLRIDFSFDRKLTDEEKQEVETVVNTWIKEGLEVVRKEMPLSEAEKLGAEMEFGQKYPDVVSVYFIQDKEGNVISKEFCGGPHAESTSLLGTFKIKSEKASSAGVRRIKATLE